MADEAGHILAVDDHKTNRIKMSFAVKKLGHTVDQAENGQQALEMLRTQSFDLVLLDIVMPEMDGYQVLEQMKADSNLRDIPVIVISTETEMASVVKGIELGAEDYLPKSFDPVLLKARVGASLEKKRLRDQEQAYLEQLKIEQEKSERLLLNILPRPIAERLKQEEQTIVDSLPEATVLFADLVGFTTLAAEMPPDELIILLNEIFSTFDQLAEMHGVEKIKTIGDAYMVVGGLPTPQPDHAEAIANMALDTLHEINQFAIGTGIPLNVRIGIHTGPVIAGVIGTKKFSYDLWGDTVNTASRMESHGVVGKIQVSQESYNCLRLTHLFEERGVIKIKGKEDLVTYFLTGRK
jgi:class 3 adenylate cyclase/CheY-like chemotaxis protein